MNLPSSGEPVVVQIHAAAWTDMSVEVAEFATPVTATSLEKSAVTIEFMLRDGNESHGIISRIL
jgi:hypothetical protein